MSRSDEAAPLLSSLTLGSVAQRDNDLQLGVTALQRLLNFLAGLEGNFFSGRLEAAQHACILNDGVSYLVRRYNKGKAAGRAQVLKVFKKSISPGTPDPITREELRSLFTEIRILSCRPLNENENIVTLESIVWGVHSLEPTQICPAFLLEQATFSDLDTFQTSVTDLDWITRQSICYDVANGLSALHSCGIVHGCLNGSHILIFEHPKRKYLAKINGFGHSVILSSSESPSIPKGTVPWNAPEVDDGQVRHDQVFETDIFSLGLLFWKIFVHQDPIMSFDLPLDKAIRDEEFRQILVMPYLFRFIPLLIEHEVEFLDDETLGLLTALFSCTVRISPRQRHLKEALELLQPYSGRDAQIIEHAEAPLFLSIHEGNWTEFDTIQASSESIRQLPFIVQKQWINSLHQICDSYENPSEQRVSKGETMIETSLVSSAVWTLVLCWLQGLGTDRNPDAALQILHRFSFRRHKFFDLVRLLSPLLCEALEGDIATKLGAEMEAMKISDHNCGRVGPWIKLGWDPSMRRPQDHGILKDKQCVIDLCAEYATGHPGPSSQGPEMHPIDLGLGNTLLHGAAFYGLRREVELLLESGWADLNAVNHHQETALLLACETGHHEVVLLLLSGAADASIENNREENGLHWLCSFPEDAADSIATDLARQGASLKILPPQEPGEMEFIPVAQDLTFLEDGRFTGNAVMQAVINRDTRSLTILYGLYKVALSRIENDTKLVILIDFMFSRPLRLASELHLYDILEYLCLELISLLSDMSSDCLPVSWRSAILRLEHDPQPVGAMFFAFTTSTASCYAAIETSFQIMRLCYHGESWRLASRNTLEILEKYGFLTNMVRTKQGPTRTLDHAISCGNHEAIKFLLEKDSLLRQVDAAGDEGYTPVHLALKYNQFDILTQLVEKGATVDLRKKRDPSHCLSGAQASYLHVLASLRTENVPVARFLMDHGLPPMTNDIQGVSALNLALMRGAFWLAQILIENGASLLSEGIFGLTPIAQIFVPGQVEQYDDIFETLRFLLSYEKSSKISLFITSRELGYSILHTAAAYYSLDPSYPKVLEHLLHHYNKPQQLNAKANTPAKSTPLHIAISSQNHIAVKALLRAGALTNEKDLSNRTPLALAQETLRKLVFSRELALSVQKSSKIERATDIIILIAEKTSWPASLEGLPTLFQALDQVGPLLEQMRLSIHQVSFMRKLETETVGLIHGGMKDMLSHLDLDGHVVIRRIIEKTGRPVIRANIDYRVLPNAAAVNPSKRYDAARNNIPWCTTLSNARLEEFQEAAAFEWLVDQAQQGFASRNDEPRLGVELSRFSRTPKPENLPFDPVVVRFPITLLAWYEKAIRNNEFLVLEENRNQIHNFVTVLRQRAELQKCGIFPLPSFDDAFRHFHFDMLQPAKLEPQSAFGALLLATRCRCSSEKIGHFSRSDMLLLTQRVSSLDDAIWTNRLESARVEKSREMRDLVAWKESTGIRGSQSMFLSLIQEILVLEKQPDEISFLAHPDMVEYAEDNKKQQPGPLTQISIDLRKFNTLHKNYNKASGHLKSSSVFLDEGPDYYKSTLHFSEKEKTLTVAAFKVDDVDGTGGDAMRITDTLLVVGVPVKEPSQEMQPIVESKSLEDALLRVMHGDIRFKATPGATLLDIPWFDDIELDPTMAERLNNHGWGPVVKSEQFRIFQIWRRRESEVKLWYRPFRTYFAQEIKDCDNPGITEALSHVKSVAERTFISTMKGHVGSTSMGVRTGDGIFVIPGCSFTVLLRKISGDKDIGRDEVEEQEEQKGHGHNEGQETQTDQDVNEKERLSAREKNKGVDKVEHWEVVGECYLEGLMDGEAMKMFEEGKLSMEEVNIS